MLIKNYSFSKQNIIFTWHLDLSWAYKLLLSIGFALLTAYAAQVYIPLSWTPVPITLQTGVVLLSGILLKKWWGGLSQLLYLIAGLIGLPVFSSMTFGFDARTGYFFGFVLTSFLVGHVVERFKTKSFKTRSFVKLVSIISLIYVLSIYGLGCLYLAGWIYFTKGFLPTISNLLWMGVIPFLIGDGLKIMLVSLFTTMVLPNKNKGQWL